ncbi:Metallophosphoesterase [Candidatus Sulfopaludibacter sp. SbA4]|nr:Metallophosphoesterase [Candidatus Sulfopaludibacter sp. SbA4]
MNPLDRILSVIFFFAQWRITVLWLRMARRRWPARVAPRRAIYVIDVVLAGGVIFSYTGLAYRLEVPEPVAAVMGGAVLCYLMAATAVLALHTVVDAVRKRWAADLDPGRRRVLNAAGSALMATPLAVLGYGALIQRTDFRVREIDVPLPGLPQDLDGFRLLHLSDIHLSAFLSEAELARVIDAARELRPHLAVMTGDLISGPGDPLDAGIRQLARLQSDAGIFGCMGNHERYAKAELYTAQAGARAGIQFLRSQSRQLRFGTAVINLAGVDYQSLTEKRSYLRGAERMVAPGAFNILLSHNPDVFPLAAQQGYNLLLAGHTHGGQVTIEILQQGINPARFFTPFVHGLYRSGAAAAYVTRGIGTIGIPARIGAPPEISVLRLRKA